MSQSANQPPHFTIVRHPNDLPTHAQITAGAPHYDSLYAVGVDIDALWVYTAYQRGLFPWYNEGNPVLWHSPDPRMVLRLDAFKTSPSLHKKLKQWARQPETHQVTVNRCFERVIEACANATRQGQQGTWINPELAAAYIELHQQQHALSIEVWQEGDLVAGLYGVLIGKMFFGESMFTTVSDGSKIALACWVQHLAALGGEWIDCQQVTAHLASLGACPVPRTEYFERSAELMTQSELDWSALSAQHNLLSAFAPSAQASVEAQ